MGKIISIVGVRPNFVKLAALHGKLPKTVEHVIVHTGQHYDYELSKTFFDCFELPEPEYNLDVGSGSPSYQVGEIIKRSESVLMKEKPDLVIVYGDTNSTFAGSFAAVQLHLRVAHVESGYRSHDKSMPEEVNRILTDHISDLLFVPTMSALQNLRKESVQGKTYLTGDVMCDVLLDHLQMADEKSGILKKLGVSPKEYLLLTFHRVKNTDNIDVLRRLVGALLILKDFPIVFPIHPRTEKMLKKAGLLAKLEESKNILIIPPLNYLDFVKLEKNANKIITDSGGVQKEAYILGVPCVTLRDATEIGETVAEGWNFLAADDPAVIVDAVRNFHSQNQSKRRALGDGKAANRIMKILLEDLEVNKHCSS